jgi:2'-hydroxyisoflavone reductase
MQILVLGGTEFLGRHVVEGALARGHDVTLFNRGQTRPELFPESEKLRGDRDGDLGALGGRSFDAVVDTSGYVPRVLSATLAALGDVGHYTFVSSISVYADCSTPPTEESPVDQLAEPSEDPVEHYGALKALCEDVVRSRFPDAFVPRPGLIVGPWDPTGRFTYWPLRISSGGAVLAPAPSAAPSQVIDVRDLAAWIVDAAERGTAGTFNAVAPSVPLGSILQTCVDVAGTNAELVWVDPSFLTEHGVEPWQELPLWLPGAEYAGMTDVSPERALAAGLTTRPLDGTARDTLAWALSGDAPANPPAGLDPDKEQRILAAWASEAR